MSSSTGVLRCIISDHMIVVLYILRIENTSTILSQMIITLFTCRKNLFTSPTNMSIAFYTMYMFTTSIFINRCSTLPTFLYSHFFKHYIFAIRSFRLFIILASPSRMIYIFAFIAIMHST